MSETIIVKYTPQPQDEKKQEKEIIVAIEYNVVRDVEEEVYKCTVMRHEEDLPMWLKPSYFEIKTIYPTKDYNAYVVEYPPMDNIDARLFAYEVYGKIYGRESYKLMSK